jgi:TRAP-type C4-dicarboxylate transport system permease small subunit
MQFPSMQAVENVFERFVSNTCKVFLIIQVLVVAYVVFGRFVLNSTPGWGEELSLLCMVWFSLMSIALGVKRDSHISMNLSDFIFPIRFKPVLGFLSAVVDIGVAVVMITAGWRIAVLTSYNTMSGLGIRSVWLFASVPVGGAFVLLAVVLRLLRKRREK